MAIKDNNPLLNKLDLLKTFEEKYGPRKLKDLIILTNEFGSNKSGYDCLKEDLKGCFDEGYDISN